MGNELLASKTIIQEEEPRIRSVPALKTAVVGMLGVTERGPFSPTRVTSFEEYVNVYGGFNANSDVALAAQAFFENGGQFLTVKRIVHLTDVTDPATKISSAATLNLLTAAAAASAGTVLASNAAPFDLEPGDTLVIDVDAGGDVTATFDAAAASRTSGNTETFDLANGLDLTVEIDGGSVQTIVFLTGEFVDIANATAAEVAAVINAKITGAFADVSAGAVVITSDKRGTDSGVNVTGGTANTGGVNRLGFTTGNIAGTGDVADIDAVTFAEIKSVVEADVAGLTVTDEGGGQPRFSSNTTGPASSILINATSTADDELGLDNATHSGSSGAAVNTLQVDGKTDGEYANTLSIQIAAATSGETGHFNLTVVDDGVVKEVFPNLSMDSTADDYVETVINDAGNGSNLIAVTDLLAVAPPANVPATGTFGPLAGGDDGLTGLADTDFIGSDAGKTGLRALDLVNDITLLTVPGQATSAIHNAMITYAEITRGCSMVAVLDPPADQSANDIITYVETTANILESSEHAIIYWPRVEIQNPSTAVYGDVERIVAPPSGHIVGVYARTDASQEGGIYQPPAGVERGQLRGVLGFEGGLDSETLDESKRDLVYPKRINSLTSDDGQPPFIDGTRTLKSNGNFPTIAERRGVIFIEQSIKKALQFARHSNNTPELRAAVTRTVQTFLISQMNVGAFRSTDPATAFQVDFGEGLNPTSVVLAGKLVGRIGLATNRPADFVILKFSQDVRALEQELANAGL